MEVVGISMKDCEGVDERDVICPRLHSRALPRNGHREVSFQISVKVYWLDINYLMLWSSLHAVLTSKSTGDPKYCKGKWDPVDQRGNSQYR